MTDTLAVARPARPSRRPGRSPWWALAVVLTGQFMAVLDASVVNVAAPSIHASLHTSGAGLQLVIAGYVITYAVLLVTGARLGDILGHRRMFLSGLVLFTLASLGCGLAASSGPTPARRGRGPCGCTRPCWPGRRLPGRSSAACWSARTLWAAPGARSS